MSIDEVITELSRLHRVHSEHDHTHAASRTMNLTVAPHGADVRTTVTEAIDRLGSHNASRTIVLREHDADRLDAELVVSCRVPGRPGEIGLCHDRVTLSADRARLAHASSMVAPLLILDLPSVVWMPDPAAELPDPDLLERVDQLVLDTDAAGPEAIRNAARLARHTAVRDLSWGRLDFWRAATAAAFDPPERRALVERIDSLEVTFTGESPEPAFLYAGWIAARAGWTPGKLVGDHGRRVGRARRGERAVEITLRHDSKAPGCGGIETAVFGAGDERVVVRRGAASDDLRDLLPVAVRPIASFARGYEPAIRATTSLLG
jgi:glucose-6-phosphate dehydrogenase assembly protein OpcA